VEILKILVGLEREEFGIDGKIGVDDSANSSISISFVSASGGRILRADLLRELTRAERLRMRRRRLLENFN
jgi:hypothetical protein